MSDFKLNFKASNIAKAEKAYNENFFKVISGLSSTPSISNLMFLFLAGGASEEEFDEILKDGIDNAMVIVIEGLNDSGFLGEKIDTQELKKAMDKVKTEAKK